SPRSGSPHAGAPTSPASRTATRRSRRIPRASRTCSNASRRSRPSANEPTARTRPRSPPHDRNPPKRSRTMTLAASETTTPAVKLPPRSLFIDGRWQDASDGSRMDVIAPATGAKLTDVAKATTDDVDAAVAAARTAFDSGVWSGLSSRERARILQRAYALMRERSEELAQLETPNVGKPITFARVVDVNNAAELYEYYAGLGHHLDGSVRESTGNTHVYVKKEPIGVVAAITPFNFPLILSSTKIAPALLAGNTIVH